MKRKLWVVLIIVLLFCAFPVSVSANSAPPLPWYWFELTNLPEGTVYVDMLIRLPEEDLHYTALAAENLPDGFAEDAPIVEYCHKDFRSYTFHYKNAKSMIKVGDDQAVFFFTDTLEDEPLWEHKDDVYDRGRIRLAMLDESGNILKVSRSFSVKRSSIFSYQYNSFHYDANKDILLEDTGFSAFALMLYLLISIAGVVVTCFVESWIALLFHLHLWYSKLILLTNVVSQILMRVLHVLLYGWIFVHYAWMVVLLEIAVYSGEYFWYRSRMKDMPRNCVLWFTIAANTASLVLSIVPLILV